MPMSDLHFVIIERDSFIAEDMAQGLRASCPNCAISRLVEMQDAATLPHDSRRRTVFITGDRIAHIDQSGLTALARAEGAGIVVRAGWDTDEEVEARGFVSLAAPFTDVDLCKVAKRLTRRPLPTEVH